MKRAAIVGFGRFGELLANLGREAFDLSIVESDPIRRGAAERAGFRLREFASLPEVELIFLAIPISVFEETVRRLAPLADGQHTVIDVCSVKVYPARLMRQYLTRSRLLATHPMFGPDSAKKGLQGLQIAFCPLRIAPAEARVIHDFWAGLGVSVIETTPEQHDRDAVYSLAFTYAVARVILDMQLPAVGFRTRNFDALTHVAESVDHDGARLFHDMLFYNPYYSAMKRQLEAAFGRTAQRLDEIAAEQSRAELFPASSER